MGVISPPQSAPVGVGDGVCWKGGAPVPPALRLLAASEARAGDGEAQAVAANPSVRSGEINKSLQLHVGRF